MIGRILKPWTFVNNTQNADALKVNADFDVVFAAVNEIINALNSSSGSRPSLASRLGVSLNDDGTIKGTALPVGTYDTRSSQVVTEDYTITEADSIVRVNADDGPITITLPPAATAAVCPIIVCKSASGNAVTIMPDGDDTVMGLASVELSVGGESIKIAPDGTDWDRIG